MDKHDHRVIGRHLDLFHLQDEAPGMVFWHPRGWQLYRALEAAVRRHVEREGYEEVRSPQVLRQPIWESSGHWSHFREHMMVLADEASPAALKPVSCPGHIQILARRVLSYRDLPVRYAEFGLVHRDEQRGALHGLMRLRQFCQDDGHIFCAREQIAGEVERFCRSVGPFYAAFGFPRLDVALSLRPPSRLGEDALWDEAEAALLHGARAAGHEPRIQPGEGAFYGPKLEFSLIDHAGRSWQCGTVQLDFALPERFDLSYADAADRRVRPVMLHRALLGSLERFLGVLLEQWGGRLPAWLSPVQVAVLPVKPEQRAEAEALVEALRRAGLRASLDGRDESLARRVAEAHDQAVPYVLALGPRDLARGEVALRVGAEVRSLPRVAAIAELIAACAPPV